MATATAMSTDAALYRLLAWLSPAYPVGAYSYSHGLEWAVEAGLVRDRAGLEAWLATVLRHGGGWQDAVLLAHAHRARDAAATMPAGASCARSPRPGRRPPSWRWRPAPRARPSPPPASPPGPIRGGRLAGLLADGPGLTYPLAVGAVAAVPRRALAAGPAGLPAGLRRQPGLRRRPPGPPRPDRRPAAPWPRSSPWSPRRRPLAADCPLDELGTATLMVDLCSMRHETQYTRLFRS